MWLIEEKPDMKTIALMLVIIFCAVVPASTVQTPSHCSASEAVIFSCKIKGSTKILSLCGSERLSKDTGYLQYRFGPPDAVELTFPKAQKNSLAQFLYLHYFRAQVDRTYVSFKSGGHKYSIYDDYDGEEKPAKRSRGVTIENEESGPSKERNLECAGPVISHLEKLKMVIPCDKMGGLGDCP
jgi:hypothetical protein